MYKYVSSELPTSQIFLSLPSGIVESDCPTLLVLSSAAAKNQHIVPSRQGFDSIELRCHDQDKMKTLAISSSAVSAQLGVITMQVFRTSRPSTAPSCESGPSRSLPFAMRKHCESSASCQYRILRLALHTSYALLSRG